MSVNQPPKKEESDSLFGLQPYLVRTVVVIAVALVILPLLPGLISNLIYSYHSFGGKAPKIYWYLSRASGFVSYTILWISMALGLGITNKMARLWPGAPSAFAVHQYTSMLGLAFAAYHGLVLMGDHFVDFSLTRLMTPFSIAYKTAWIGLGQLCFYIWFITVLSFYVRQFIGQKTWRWIHYANFAVFVMGFLHGINSGTDSGIPWVVWYFWISGVSLVVLLAYRIYDSSLKGKIRISLPKFGRAHVTEVSDAVAKSPTQPSIATRVRNLPQALLRSQAKKSVLPQESEQIMEPVAVQTHDETPVQASASEAVQEQAAPAAIEQQATSSEPANVPIPVDEVKATKVIEQQAPILEPVNAPAPVDEVKASKVKEISRGPVIKLEGISQGKKIRVRIFGEPVTRPIPELQDSDEITFPEELNLLVKLKNRFRGMPVEPIAPNQRSKRIVFSED